MFMYLSFRYYVESLSYLGYFIKTKTLNTSQIGKNKAKLYEGHFHKMVNVK